MDHGIALEGFFFEKLNGSTGQRVKHHFFGADDTRLRPHHCKRRALRLLPGKRHTASKSLIPSKGIFTSYINEHITECPYSQRDYCKTIFNLSDGCCNNTSKVCVTMLMSVSRN